VILKATYKFAVETTDNPMTQENSHFEITNDENAHQFLRDSGVLFALNSFYKA
jgi:hypothetical protein